MSTWDARSVVPMTLVSETGQEGNSANTAIQPGTAPRALIWRTQDADPLRSRFRLDIFWRYLPPKHSPESAPPPYDQRTEESTARTISSQTQGPRKIPARPSFPSTRHEQIASRPCNQGTQKIALRTHSPRHIPTPAGLTPPDPRAQRGNNSGGILTRYTDPDNSLVLRSGRLGGDLQDVDWDGGAREAEELG